MTSNFVFRSLTKLGAIASVVSLSAIAAGVVAPSASALSLVPQAEGEVNVGLGSCLGSGCSYLSIDPLISSIESLVDSSTGTRSRLFVDKAGTNNTYGAVRFRSRDIGTSEGSGDYWFRPVSMSATGVGMEEGQLEVGTFMFNFSNTLASLSIDWFDTEANGTGYTVFYADGTQADGSIAPGSNNNVATSMFSNVSGIKLNLGEKGARFKTGDGVNFQMEAEAVPEPVSTFGLGAVAIASVLGLRKKQAQA